MRPSAMMLCIAGICAGLISAAAQAVGACCDSDAGECIDFPDPMLCDMFNGTWMGDGTECSTVDCSAGACCTFTFEYECWDATSAAECQSMDGDFLGALSTCELEGSYCQSAIGACCIDDNDCWDFISEDECGWMGGKFFGEGTTCSQDAPWCVMLIGACCFGDSCEDWVEHDECEMMGGVFWADDCSLLEDVEMCVPSPGACCYGDTECVDDVAEAECWSSGGAFYGVGSTCDADGAGCAPYPIGACCLEDGDCFEADFLDCLFSDGDFLEDESCSSAVCIECLADFELDGEINVSDLLVVIANWGNPYGVDELLLVISEWGMTCP